MNFKTLLSLSAFSLIGVINAAPVNNGCQCNHRCQGYLLQFNEKAYTCLTPANFVSLRGKLCVNVKGYYSNQTSVYCVDEENSTIGMCNKSSKEYNYNECMRNIYFKGGDMKIDISVYNEEQIKAEILCKQKEGYYLPTDDEKYACIIEKNAELNEECVTINGDPRKTYCLFNTNVDICNREKDEYDGNECFNFISLAGRQNKLYLEKLTGFKPSNAKDKKTCEGKNGIYLSFSDEKYVCLVKPTNEERNNNVCVTVKKHEYATKTPDKKVYCIDEKLTTDQNCNKNSDKYDLNKCLQYVVSVGRSNSYSIELIQ